MVVRLVVTDPSTMVRLGYVAALAGQPDLVLVGEAATAAQARRLMTTARPDVIVLDAGLPDPENPAGAPGPPGRTSGPSPSGGPSLAGRPSPGGGLSIGGEPSLGGGLSVGGGLNLGREIRAERPDLGVILVGPPDDDLLFRALEERFSAYLPRSAPVDVLLSAVRHAAVAPTAFTTPDLATALTRRRVARATLSPRESEVLRHLCVGANNAGIASSMRLTESTVRTYLARVYDKLGVHSRAQALVAATERGLLH